LPRRALVRRAAGEAALALAADDVNAQLTAQGSPVRVSLRVENTGLDPTRALDRLRTLAGEGVRIFIGPQSSSEVNALKVFADSAGVIILSQGSTAGALSIPDDNVFRLVPDDAAEGAAMVELLRRTASRPSSLCGGRMPATRVSTMPSSGCSRRRAAR
jgi:ABC-type branched-subunit amino acid transport system substrate-binding protein